MQSSAQDPGSAAPAASDAAAASAAPGAPDSTAAAAAHGHVTGGLITPRSDFVGALVWMMFGLAVSVLSYNMERLANQDVPPYAVPGLLPFFLGIAVIFFGGLMALRSWRRGALAKDAESTAGMNQAERKRFLIVLALCLAFAILLVGHGLPFWLASAIFVSATISVLQYAQRKAAGQLLRGFAIAIAIGLGAGFGVTLVFQQIFLVYLP
jgi:hypothetical protein